jgi:hypothetical protein
MSKKDEYKYSNLNTLSEKNNDPVHFYGTVVDASFPYKTEKRSVVTCKVVDHSLAKKGQVHEKDWVTVVFYAKNFEDLPIIQRVGDIIRVHRAEFHYHNDRRQLNVNLFFRGSWCLFVGNDKDKPLEPKVVNEHNEANFFSHTPYNFSGKSFTWGDEDVSILKNLRKWTKETFSKNWVVGHTQDASATNKAIKDKKDFDILGKVVSVKDHNKWSNTVTINDANGTSWTADLFKKKFPHLAEGDAVRVRSVNSNDAHHLSLANHSNVLHFISGSKISGHLHKISNKVTASGHCISTITNKTQAKQNATNLKQLFFNPKKSSGVFHAEFNVLKTDPSKTGDWVKGKGKKAKTSVKLVVTDHHAADDEKAYMIHCEDEKFFGKHNHAAAKKLLTHKGNWVSAILERQGKNYFVVNTKLQ